MARSFDRPGHIANRYLRKVKGAAVAVSRDEVFEILRGVVPRLEEALPGWSVRPNITVPARWGSTWTAPQSTGTASLWPA